jgi:hypothetical protein
VKMCSVFHNTDSHAGGKDNIGRQIQTTVQWNSSISETVRNRHIHTHTLFCLEWSILWPPTILTFAPGASVYSSEMHEILISLHYSYRLPKANETVAQLAQDMV